MMTPAIPARVRKARARTAWRSASMAVHGTVRGLSARTRCCRLHCGGARTGDARPATRCPTIPRSIRRKSASSRSIRSGGEGVREQDRSAARLSRRGPRFAASLRRRASVKSATLVRWRELHDAQRLVPRAAMRLSVATAAHAFVPQPGRSAGHVAQPTDDAVSRRLPRLTSIARREARAPSQRSVATAARRHSN